MMPVDDGYFRTLQVPIVTGRGFDRDNVNSTPAGIVNQLLVHNEITFDDQEERRSLQARKIFYVFGVLGVFTLLLGIVGTYGTMATLVAQRRREVGIRVTLGPHPSPQSA
jgi:ABC-type antimicrobial peptide transport system permease subunit